MRQFSNRCARLSALVVLGLVAGGCGSSSPGNLFGGGDGTDGGLDGSIDGAVSHSASASGSSLQPDTGTSASTDASVAPTDSAPDASAEPSASLTGLPDGSLPTATMDGSVPTSNPSDTATASAASSVIPLPSVTFDGGGLDGGNDGGPIGSASASTDTDGGLDSGVIGTSTSSTPSATQSASTDSGVPSATQSASSTAQPPACLVGFVGLSNGDDLDINDDEDTDCSNEIQYTVHVATNLADGEQADLLINGANPVRVAAAGGEFVFNSVALSHNDTTTLSVAAVGDSACTAAVTVDGNCPIQPTCDITFPVLTADKPALNDIAAPSGDRVSAQGQSYRTRFTVSTDLADGALVLLDVDNGTTTLAGYVSNGVATFASVELGSDGAHTVVATCTGETSTDSAPFSAPVDTAEPTIVTASLTPVDGQHYSPQQDVDGVASGLQFDVCVPVGSSDALDLTGSGASNVCVAIGNGAPICAPATASNAALSGADGACVRLDCPGSAGFDLDVTLTDAAGNPSAHTIAGLTCASTEPSVQIVSLQDATTDTANVAKHLLAATAGSNQLKDENSGVSGAQHTLVACTDAPSGSARLLAGLQGSSLTQRATATIQAAQVGDNCPPELPYVAIFSEATLPQSVESPSLTLTEVVVEVTDPSTETNESSPVRLWVDSVSPTITLFAPGGLCGSGISSGVDVTRNLQFISSAFPRTLTVNVENGGNFSSDYTFTSSAAQSVDLPLGTNIIHGVISDAAGNVTRFQNDTCEVFVGNPPTVAWVSPPDGTGILNASTTSAAGGTVQDADGATSGWQGTLSVTVGNLQPGDVASGSVQFKVNNTNFGSAIPLSTGSGDATSRTVSLDTATAGGIPDGANVTITASVTGTLTSAAGSLSNVLIDTVEPTEALNVVPAIGPNPGDRRRTRFQLTWDAAGDGSLADQDVDTYEVAYTEAGTIDDQTEFDAAFASNGLTLPTTPAAPGQPESMLVDGLTIEHVYYFAVQALDAAGNRGPIAGGIAAGADSPGLAARFKTTVLGNPGPSEERFGFALDGSTDLTGDGYAELVVSSFNPDQGGGVPSAPHTAVYIYKGGPTGYSQSPLVTINCPSTARYFGYSVAVVGDVNDDTPPSATATQVAHAQDLVITAQYDDSAGGVGVAYVFFGRDWDSPSNQTLTESDADALIATAAPDFEYGEVDAVTRLGDFNSDGVDDFALTHFGYSNDGFTTTPGAVSVILGRSGFASVGLADDASFGTDALLLRGSGFTLLGSGPLTALSNGAVLVAGSDDNSLPGIAALFEPTSSAITEYSSAHLFTVADPEDVTWQMQFGIARGNVVAIANPNLLSFDRPAGTDGKGIVDVFLGNNASNPFGSSHVTVFDRNVTTAFGRVTLGNAHPGHAAGYALPFLGDPADAAPNLVLGGVIAPGGGPPDLHFLSGDTLASLNGATDLGDPQAPVSDLTYSLKNVTGAPQTWANGAQATAIHDLDGDGYADLAVGESTNSLLTDFYDGHVIVLY